MAKNKSRIGTYITSTVAGERCRAFIPPPLPPDLPLDLGPLYPAIDRATQALGRLDGITTLLPDLRSASAVSVFHTLHMHHIRLQIIQLPLRQPPDTTISR